MHGTPTPGTRFGIRGVRSIVSRPVQFLRTTSTTRGGSMIGRICGDLPHQLILMQIK